MILKNCSYYDDHFVLQQGHISCHAGVIAALDQMEPDQAVFDLKGLTVFPGLIDLHIHGCAGVQADDASVLSIQKMSRFLAREGVTGFLPTLMAGSHDHLAEAVKAASLAQPTGARVLGLHLEGPYFTSVHAGVQQAEFFRDPDIEEIKKLDRLSGGLIKLVDLAPERSGTLDFIAAASTEYRIGIAHTDADYDTTYSAITAGAQHAVHLFNGMSGLHHRHPGAAAAILDHPHLLSAELICDGVHVHPAFIRLAARLLGRDRLVLVSDALAPAGLPPGDYSYGEQSIHTTVEGQAYDPDGRLAGSTLTLMECLRRAVQFGLPLEDALRAVTINPARVLGLDKKMGSICVGKSADFTVVDQHLEVKMVFIGGKPYNRGLSR